MSDVAADHLHNYPEFMRDFAKGFFLGEHEGTYYFWDHGTVTEFKGEYSVSNNVSNYFSGPVLHSNGVRFYPAKMVLAAFMRVEDREAFQQEGNFYAIPKDHPFNAETLCLETIKRIEDTLPLIETPNGWHHFLLKLETLSIKNRGKILQIEGFDYYLFIAEDSLVIKYDTSSEVANCFRWEFSEEVVGFKISKKLVIKLIEQQKFAIR